MSNGVGETPKKSRKNLYIGLGVAGAVLLLSCCCLGVGGPAVWYGVYAPETNAKVTKANFRALKKDMKFDAVENLLGTGKPTTLDVLRATYKARPSPDLDSATLVHTAKIKDEADYYWKNGDDTIFVFFDKAPKKDGKPVPDAKVVQTWWVTSTSATLSTEGGPSQ